MDIKNNNLEYAKDLYVVLCALNEIFKGVSLRKKTEEKSIKDRHKEEQKIL